MSFIFIHSLCGAHKRAVESVCSTFGMNSGVFQLYIIVLILFGVENDGILKCPVLSTVQTKSVNCQRRETRKCSHL